MQLSATVCNGMSWYACSTNYLFFYPYQKQDADFSFDFVVEGLPPKHNFAPEGSGLPLL